ncbi:MAG: GtrA family protein [Clostridia bacterium]|nr:GtrA family protein [Clostridia bacterium]
MNDNLTKTDVTEQTSVEETAASQTDGEATATEKKKIKLPAFLQKFFDYLNAHEDIRQMVFFFMFSIICGVSQMIITYALSAGLKLESHLGGTRLDWFVFHYATQAEFIGFLVGSFVGQVLTFVLNRKKTFNVPDYVALRAVMYTIMAVLIIIMQTALGGAVTDACWSAKPDANGFLDFVFNLTGQAVAGIAALVVNFLGNKFFVMRDWGKKKRLAAERAAQVNGSEAAQSDELCSLAAADTQASDEE